MSVIASCGKSGQSFAIKNRFAVDQHDVAADGESGGGPGQLYRVFKCAPVRHQRGGGDDAASVGFDNGAIHARSEAEIIGVDDQTAHCASLAGLSDNIGLACCLKPLLSVRGRIID